MAECAKAGRDKLTLVLSPGLQSLGAWIEHLVACSTGKAGSGILPIDGEALAHPDRYGEDRVFVDIVLEDDDDEVRAVVLKKLDTLHAAGHPVISISLADPRDIAQELFRWQVATATAAHVLGLTPFAEPDVRTSQAYVADLITAYARDGVVADAPGLVTVAEGEGLILSTDADNAAVLKVASGVQDILRTHLGRVEPGDYVALLAFVEANDVHEAVLQRIRTTIRDDHRVATTVGFGPRCLHTTGQFHKGGPNSGVFIQLTADDADDIIVPGQSYSFGTLRSAQHSADFRALAERGRRLLRVHLGANALSGLETLARLLTTH